MRYLVVVPGLLQGDEPRFHDVETDDDLTNGDELLIDDVLVRVCAAMEMPPDGEYDGAMVARRDD